MSLSLIPIPSVEVRDPRTVIREKVYSILKGGAAGGVSWKPFTTTNVSSSNITFSAPPPNFKTWVDRKQYFLLPVRIVFNSSAPTANVLMRPDLDAPRQAPISGSLSTLSVSLNNTAVSINMSDVIKGLLRFDTGQYLKEHDYSMSPMASDMSQNYSDLFSTARNPLNSYGESVQESVMSRGGFSHYTIVENSTSQAIIDCIFVEPIFLSPFYFGYGNATAFINLQTMDFNFTFVQNPAFTMWSHDAVSAVASLPGPITSSQVAFINQSSIGTGNPSFTYGMLGPELLFNYITPERLQTIPSAMIYSYFDVARYPTDFNGTMGIYGSPTATSTLTSNTIVLQSIPRRIYIWARANNTSLQSSPNLTDTFLSLSPVNPLQVSWNNYNGLFANATSWDQLRFQ